MNQDEERVSPVVITNEGAQHLKRVGEAAGNLIRLANTAAEAQSHHEHMMKVHTPRTQDDLWRASHLRRSSMAEAQQALVTYVNLVAEGMKGVDHADS